MHWARRQYGRGSVEALLHRRRYMAALRAARRGFVEGLEGSRLSSPKDFWRLLRPPHKPLQITPHTLHAHYRALFDTLPTGYLESDWLAPTLAAQQPITGDEVQAAVAKLRRNKALGDQWLCPELLGGHEHPGIYAALAIMYNAVWIHGIAASWNQLRLTSLHKKGDPTDPGNYRGLSVMATTPKLLAQLLLARLEDISEANQLRAPTQAGFR